ncbi:MAG: hypothetical protein LCH54_13790 [Bacteroidetes bacterium]|nr:hypothetical protein [Bacteroidota bacterium]
MNITIAFFSIFSFIYEIIIGENSDFPEYREGIFDSVGLITLIISVAICLLFYVGLGRWKALWYTMIHWVITILIVASIGFGFAFSQAKGELGDVDSYLIRFAIFNAMYAALYFIAFSFLFKNFSIFSKRTPI